MEGFIRITRKDNGTKQWVNTRHIVSFSEHIIQTDANDPIRGSYMIICSESEPEIVDAIRRAKTNLWRTAE